MELQKKLLKQYEQTFETPTLRKMSQDSGIQLTRLFRIFNGYQMKITEYEMIRKKVLERKGLVGNIEELAFNCSTKLSLEMNQEIESFLKRKLELWNLKNLKNVNMVGV